MRPTSQASTIKRTAVKTPTNTSKIRFEAPLPKTTLSSEEFYKKVQEKAYELYLQRNGAAGSAEEDWQQAEKIVKGS
jgi:hypothetical protein